ncbi:hypothetical protein NADFUDRAFT_41827 [Nadsonia fulvescens var. elongata DSM 6958]|uniref:Uncharacterized protein n=1 Tax=Nadsonia fulvescens var. elongata DSM 6958 TaxID=857566 RepID=A0A1E3PKH1_9ASCO|nr:hypothetical protein NADFUDRAFT_41827 [Nadsonia fulvescens var. elongata DSM 6958]
MISLAGGHVSMMQRPGFNWADLTTNENGSSFPAASNSLTNSVNANACHSGVATCVKTRCDKPSSTSPTVVAPVVRLNEPIVPDRPLSFKPIVESFELKYGSVELPKPTKSSKTIFSVPSMAHSRHPLPTSPNSASPISLSCNILGSLSLLTGVTTLTFQGLLGLLELIAPQIRKANVTRKDCMNYRMIPLSYNHSKTPHFALEEFQRFITSTKPPATKSLTLISKSIIKILARLAIVLRWKLALKCLLWLVLGGLIVYPKVKCLVTKPDSSRSKRSLPKERKTGWETPK